VEYPTRPSSFLEGVICTFLVSLNTVGKLLLIQNVGRQRSIVATQICLSFYLVAFLIREIDSALNAKNKIVSHICALFYADCEIAV
jgi:hypothetical protein